MKVDLILDKVAVKHQFIVILHNATHLHTKMEYSHETGRFKGVSAAFESQHMRTAIQD